MTDKGVKLLLYKAQIWPYLEYAALSWMWYTSSHTRKLDSIQRRALRLVDAADSTPQPVSARPLDSLEHRRDITALVVFHKSQVQAVCHTWLGYVSLHKSPHGAQEQYLLAVTE